MQDNIAKAWGRSNNAARVFQGAHDSPMGNPSDAERRDCLEQGMKWLKEALAHAEKALTEDQQLIERFSR